MLRMPLRMRVRTPGRTAWLPTRAALTPRMPALSRPAAAYTRLLDDWGSSTTSRRWVCQATACAISANARQHHRSTLPPHVAVPLSDRAFVPGVHDPPLLAHLGGVLKPSACRDSSGNR